MTGFPATVVVGGSATDSAGLVFDFAPGTFLFPVIAPGDYRLEVSAPLSYTFPSVIDDGTLDALPGGPYVLTPGSRGAAFTVTSGAPVAFVVPLDPISAEIFVSKQASKDTTSIGEFVQYRIQVQNGDASGTVTNLRLIDDLPLGFRYAEPSLRVADAAVAPLLGDDGRRLVIDLPDLGPGETLELRYVAEVGVGAKLGQARNRATVTGTGVGRANTAYADVLVREDLLQSKAILLGQVFADASDCEAPRGGMADVRIWLEDGTYVVTDEAGKYHIEGMEPGTHVVQR